jgi:hypothetical protein
MPHMGVHEYELNEAFLAGARLSIGEPDHDLPAHAELPLILTPVPV